MRPFALCIIAILWAAAPRADAQSLKDTVKQHVRENLEEDEDAAKPKPKQDKKPEKKPEEKPPPKKPAAPAPKADEPKGETLFSFSSEDDDSAEPEEEPKKKKDKLPKRVIHKNFKMDLKLGSSYRGWYPQQYDFVAVDVEHYYTWTIDVSAKFFRAVNLRHGYYESNSLSGPRTDEAAVAQEVGDFAPKAAWLLGVLGFPWFKVWEPTIKYESRAFKTRAIPSQDVCIVPRDTDEDVMNCMGTRENLVVISGFETFVAGVTYNQDEEPNTVIGDKQEGLPPLFFGIGLMSYRKPYQVTIGGNTLPDYLFDGRFRGAGVAFATELGGGIDNYFASVDVQTGLGEISLLEDLTLNELAPEDWLIGYVQGSATIGYRLPLIRGAPTLTFVPQLTMGGATFFFFTTEPDEDQGDIDSPGVNWDLLWQVRGSLVLPL